MAGSPHIIWVENGGPTTRENLVLTRRRHHHLVHDHGWEILHDGHRRFRFQPPEHDQPLPTARPLPGASAAMIVTRLLAGFL